MMPHRMAATFSARLSCRVIRKKLGLNLVSEQTDKGRVYRIKMAKLRLPLRTGQTGGLMRCRRKRRSGRASTKTSFEDEIAHLRGLDLGGITCNAGKAYFQRSRLLI